MLMLSWHLARYSYLCALVCSFLFLFWKTALDCSIFVNHCFRPFILTVDRNNTLLVSYRLENTLNYGLERVWALGYMKGSRR